MASSAELIGTAIAAAVPTTCGALAAIPVKVRKLPTLVDGESAPLIVVVVAEEGDSEHLAVGLPTDAAKALDRVTYPASVTLITEGGNQVAESPTVRQWREDAKAALNAPSTYTGLCVGFNEVIPGGKAPFDRGGLKATKNYTTVTARVEVLETRTF